MGGLKITEDEWARIGRGCAHRNADELLAMEGLYKGGEQRVESVLLPNRILPVPLDDIITVGVKEYRDSMVYLLSAAEVAGRIRDALSKHCGFSLVRLGDGELLTLAQNTVRSVEEVTLAAPFLDYAGVQIPNTTARDQLALSIVNSDVIGVPKSRRPTFQALFVELVRYYKWPVSNWNVTSSIINYELNYETRLYSELLDNYRVVLIGNRMQELADLVASSGRPSVVGVIPVMGVASVSRVLEELRQYEFDVALVSAGVAAEIICVDLKFHGKVAIDFGHLADHLIRDQRTL